MNSLRKGKSSKIHFGFLFKQWSTSLKNVRGGNTFAASMADIFSNAFSNLPQRHKVKNVRIYAIGFNAFRCSSILKTPVETSTATWLGLSLLTCSQTFTVSSSMRMSMSVLFSSNCLIADQASEISAAPKLRLTQRIFSWTEIPFKGRLSCETTLVDLGNECEARLFRAR